MFVRIKTTPNSPRKSVQIVTSVRKGTRVIQKIVRHVGVAHDDMELKQLKSLAEAIRIKLEAGDQQLIFSPEQVAEETLRAKERASTELELDYKVNLKNLREEQRVISGIHDVYGTLFDELGYQSILKGKRNKVSREIFKQIVLARIANPVSKKASVDMLAANFGISLNLDHVYQMMDKLDDEAIDNLNKLSYLNTKKLFSEKIDLVFFDCTTLYFESFEEDELRRNGYSKDLKFNQPQVVMSLMVTKEGLPIGYEIFEGSTYEGHTLIPQIKEFKKKYQIDKVVFVADAGMMNTANLEALDSENLEYIVGCRLKSLPQSLQDKVTDPKSYSTITDNLKIGTFEHNSRKIVVSYSETRARKDSYDREKCIERLKKKLEKHKNPKAYLSNFGNKKYLEVSKDIKITLNAEKIASDAKWDGLHGVITNAQDLPSQEILAQYNNLWQVEAAFRITKHDLKVRPIYHWSPRRVIAHLAISFTAFSLVKYLEYRVKLQYIKLSPEKIKQILLSVQTSILFDSTKKIRYGLPSATSKGALKIYNIFDLSRSLTPFIIKIM